MSNKTSNKIRDFVSKLKNENKIHYLFIGLIAVILVVALCINFTENKSKITQSDVIIEYVENLEAKLENTLSKIDGVGKVSVVITVESGMETVLATKIIKTETSHGIEIEETPIIVNGKTVVIQENYPEIVGVLIVANGANNIMVTNKIQKAVISLLDIELNQIEILTMK